MESLSFFQSTALEQLLPAKQPFLKISPRTFKRDIAPAPCFLGPAVKEGLYYFNTGLLRKDITENLEGVPVTYNFTVVDSNGRPIPNAVVDLWQCDKDGIYSAFKTQGTAGQTFLRGVQMTDANGQVSFTGLYPGWRNGRLTHVQAKISFSSYLYVTSRFFFPEEINKTVYQSPLYTKGQNNLKLSGDADFRGDVTSYNNLLMNLSGNINDGFLAEYTIGINTNGSRFAKKNPSIPAQFTMKEIVPHTLKRKATVKFSLLQASEVDFAIFDMMGREIIRIMDDLKMTAGEHFVDIKKEMGLLPGNYLYQLSGRNNFGQFRQSQLLVVE